MILVDSSVWIGHLRGADRPAVRLFRSLPDPDQILVGDLVLLEVLQGAHNERHAATIEHELRQFQIAQILNDTLAIRAATHYRLLRNSGHTVSKTPDLLIATYCITYNHTLLHDDRDFAPFVAKLGMRTLGSSDRIVT